MTSVPCSGSRAEIDVFRVKEHREVWIYECKARSPIDEVNGQQIDEWLNKKVPMLFNALKQESRFGLAALNTCWMYSKSQKKMGQRLGVSLK